MPDSNTAEKIHPGPYLAQALWVIVICGLSLALLYSHSLNNYFQSDDFVLLKWASGGAWCALIPSEWAFYRPCVILVFSIIYKLFSASPVAFRLTAAVFQLCNCVLLSLLALEITHSKKVSIISSVLFAWSFYHSEVIFWISCSADILLAFFCLLTLLSYRMYCRRGEQRWYVLSLVWFCCAVFTKESAFPLFLVLVACHVFNASRLPSPPSAQLSTSRRAAAKFVPFLVILFVYLMFKAPFGMINPPGKIAVNYAQYVLYGFLPFLTTHSQLSCPAYVKIAALLFACGGVGMLLWRGSMQIRFLVVCFLLFISLPAVYTVVEARYLFLPGCFSSVILAVACVRFSNYIGRVFTKPLAGNRPHSVPAGVITLITLCLAAVIPQALFIKNRETDWATASYSVKRIIQSVKEIEPDSLSGRKVYCVNLPDGIPSPIGYAFIFRNGISEALFFAYGGRSGDIEAVRLPGAEGAWRGHRKIGAEELKKLGRVKSSLILIYDYNHKIMQRYAET